MGLACYSRLLSCLRNFPQCHNARCLSRVHVRFTRVHQVFQGHGGTGERAKPSRLQSWKEKLEKGCGRLFPFSRHSLWGAIRRKASYRAVDTVGMPMALRGAALMISGCPPPQIFITCPAACLPASTTNRARHEPHPHIVG